MIRPPPRSTLFPYTTLFRSFYPMPEASSSHNNQALLLGECLARPGRDRKSTRLNSSHSQISYSLFFFLNDPAPPEIYPLPLHDALPIFLSYARSQFEPQQSGSTFGGMLGEAGKGVVRGISDVGLMTGRGAGTVLLGPIAGGLMGRGIEALAAPSREPFTPSPEGPAEKYAGTAGEFAGAFAAPGAPGLALRGIQGASRIMEPVVAPVARTMRNLIDPLLPGGTERAVGRTLLKLVGEKRAKVMSALAESQAEPLPGFVRLYRGERRPHPTLPETSYSDIGRWFTTDIGAARFYGNVKYVDVPEAVATAAKSEALVGPTIYTKTGRFLPVEWANKAKSFETSE